MQEDFLNRYRIDGFILIYSSDALISPFEYYLKEMTSFTGSFGVALMTKTQRILLTDARYTLQAPTETDWDVKDISELSSVLKSLPDGFRLGFDPILMTVRGYRNFGRLFPQGTMVPVPNPADKKLPEMPFEEIEDYPLSLAGKSTEEKLLQIAETVKARQADAFLISDPPSVAWLLNQRSHREITPVFFRKVLVDCFGNMALSPFDFDEWDGKKILYDIRETPVSVMTEAKEKGVILEEAENPCLDLKAVKNETELKAIRKITLEESRVLTFFLSYMKKHYREETELSAVRRLVNLRKKVSSYRGESFPAISATGKHGAVVHYEPTPETDVPLKTGELYLLDTGGQYWGGTTDTTRTIALGKPTKEMKRVYTAVLKGHIALASAEFPEYTSTTALDALARTALWKLGLDYGHSTSHGVGAYLNVHEMPPALSPVPSKMTLKEGMVLSDEPGCYLAEKFGIRLENTMYVYRKKNGFLGFKMLSFVPFDASLINEKELTSDEKKWLKSYEKEIMKKVIPFLPSADYQALLQKKKKIF